MEKIRTISILGPTASGKTGLAVRLAKRLGGEVVSCDSMQLYRGMDIGTATPTEEERAGVPHHMFDILDPSEECSAADYREAAAPVIADIAGRGKLPILCGGTGLYRDALMRITDFAPGEKDDALRESLAAYALAYGNEALHMRLAALDPEAAASIHPNNVRRVIRAIEICETTGMTKTEADRMQLSGDSPYRDTQLILTFKDRALLYARIETRVDLMMKKGLLEEARRLYASPRSVSKTAAAAIGYKEFLPYFRGECSLSETVDAIKLATRHYAKRQMIWFRRSEDALRLTVDGEGGMKSGEELENEAVKLLQIPPAPLEQA